MLETKKIILQCRAGGIRLTKEWLEGAPECWPPQRLADLLVLRFYLSWLDFCREIGIDISSLFAADFPPFHFLIEHDLVSGSIDIRSHRPRSGEIWDEVIWQGGIRLELGGLAFKECPKSLNRFTAVRLVVSAFILALNDGVATVGGGKSIGRGAIKVGNLEKVKSAIEKMSCPRFRCPKGHFITPKKAAFGGTCKCGSEIVPVWTIPPEIPRMYFC